MKKNTMIAIANYIKNVPELAKEYAEISTELEKNEIKVRENRKLYESAREVVLSHLTDTPMTVTELVEACGKDLPEGMSKSKVQYALINYWSNEVTKIVNAKAPNQYKKA